MFELIGLLISSGGAIGFGSVLKMLAGKIADGSFQKQSDCKVQALKDIIREAGDWDNEKLKLVIDALTEETEGGMFTRWTRRILAIIGVCVLAIGTLHCVLFASDPFITIPSIALGGEAKGGWSFLWGAISIPPSTKPIQLTLGHLAAVNFISLNMILGFYFTPGGRK